MGGLYGEGDGARRAPEEKPSAQYRTEFRRDYSRLIHSPVFRRLQGKTQLFPGAESDFFRNRLTHSLEVAQVAKSIALRLNLERPELADHQIEPDIVEFAGLAHDLGHPPFGHNGEAALDACMKDVGGFEGNAQTLRILSRLEKKALCRDAPPEVRGIGVSSEGQDFRAGLNLSARSLAAVLKYDSPIAIARDTHAGISKGYYSSESSTVNWIRRQVLGDRGKGRPLKTIECQIMDVADDIAYSTYDLEDAFKAGFLSPLEILSLGEPLRKRVAERVSKGIKAPFTATDVLAELIQVFEGLSDPSYEALSDNNQGALLPRLVAVHQGSHEISRNGYARTSLTASLVGEFVESVQLDFDPECPPLSKVFLSDAALRRVETLKHLTYMAIIESPRLKVTEYRGGEIVTTIFKALAAENGGLRLLPDDFRVLYERTESDRQSRMRTICDFIAGMTDSYALEFYARLKSENASSIFRPI